MQAFVLKPAKNRNRMPDRRHSWWSSSPVATTASSPIGRTLGWIFRPARNRASSGSRGSDGLRYAEYEPDLLRNSGGGQSTASAFAMGALPAFTQLGCRIAWGGDGA